MKVANYPGCEWPAFGGASQEVNAITAWINQGDESIQRNFGNVENLNKWFRAFEAAAPGERNELLRPLISDKKSPQ